MFIIYPNQLFPIENLTRHNKKTFFIVEDIAHFSRFKFHKHKIVLELAAMRSYAESLQKKGFRVHYEKVSGKTDERFEDKLKNFVHNNSITEITTFEIENRQQEKKLIELSKELKLKLKFEDSPMFLTNRSEFKTYLNTVEEAGGRPFMRTFYQGRRKKLRILTNKKGEPAGGQFSYENLNPMRLPRDFKPDEPPEQKLSVIVQEVMKLVEDLFEKNPGDVKDFFWPTTREQALGWLDDFVNQRLIRFGDYEDSLANHSDFIFHSALSPLLNLGLITPLEVIHQALGSAEKNEIPLQSLESFIRQTLGWREYIRGIYQGYGDELPGSNFFKHIRKLKPCWHDGTTGLPFLDECIKKAQRLSYNHHVERLMILSNVFLLCEVSPHEVFRWFTEMHLDSADWVTVPNVYGLGQYSDGGLVGTRPYICGSAYIRKMGNYPDGPWCDILDGLFWSFIEKHKDVFAENPRISVALPALRKLDPDRKKKIFAEAASFRDRVTTV
ncbi:MAG: putative deoxyribodipyrimidine photo-lyase [Bacteriovoracaceae bacterium]|nr:putative deoxyribodipyrimidine photo-lyase [Bacteriovoracaceae bacterium]